MTHEAIRKALDMAHKADRANVIVFYSFLAALLADRDRLAAEVEALKIPEGWKLVPIEPTKEMMIAGSEHTYFDDDENQGQGSLVARGRAIACYSDMIAASPEEGTS